MRVDDALLGETLEMYSAAYLDDLMRTPPLLRWLRANQGVVPAKPLTRRQRLGVRVARVVNDWRERLRVAGNALRGHYDEYDEDW